LPCNVVLYGCKESVTAFVFNSNKVEAGRTVRDVGAYMFFSHGPLNAVSVGPEQIVLRQQVSALDSEKRDQRINTALGQYSCAIIG
jgi:hypothetical protein